MPTGKQLRDARKKMNLSAERVAEKVGVSVNTIYAWESEASTPRNQKTVKKLHDLLGISVMSGKPGEPKAPLVKKVANRHKLPVKTIVADEAVIPIAQFARLLGFFIGDQARCSTLLELLDFARKNRLTVEDLHAALAGTG